MACARTARRLVHSALSPCLPWTQVAPIESKVTLFYPLSTMVDAGQILDSKKGGNALYHLDAGSTVYSALKAMREMNTGSVLVTSDGQAQGIFTERDYLTKIVVKGRGSLTTQLGDVMSKNIVCVGVDATLDQCLAVLANEKFRHLPVVSGAVDPVASGVPLTTVRGVFSVRDILKQLGQMLTATTHSIYADEVMQIACQTIEDYIDSEVPTVLPSQTIRNAVEAMVKARVGRVLVVDENKHTVGILTERDYLYKVVLEERDSNVALVKDIMTPREKLLVATPDSSVQSCIELMVDHNCRQLPVVKSVETAAWDCIGVVTVGDIIGLRHHT